MGRYEVDLAKILAEGQELTNAEKLLDFPVAVYPEMIQIQKDMGGLRRIYDVYKAQKVGCDGSQSQVEIARIYYPHYFMSKLLEYFMCLSLTSFRMQKQSGLRLCGWI